MILTIKSRGNGWIRRKYMKRGKKKNQDTETRKGIQKKEELENVKVDAIAE